MFDVTRYGLVPREVLMPFIGFVVGALICSLPYLFYSAEFPPPAITAIALALASAGLAIIRPSAKWPSGIAVGAGIVVPLATVIGIDLVRDPTSHNLWPIAFVMGLGLTMPATLLGAWVGGYLGRAAAIPRPAGAAVAAMGVLLAAAHVPLVFAERAAGERDAQQKLRTLMTAQERFRASDRSRYTCDLEKLGEGFDTPIRRHRLGRPVKGIYEVGTWARAGGYEFMLLCEQRNRGERFLLTAYPVPGALGRWAYCWETNGVIRPVDRGRYNVTGCGTDP